MHPLDVHGAAARTATRTVRRGPTVLRRFALEVDGRTLLRPTIQIRGPERKRLHLLRRLPRCLEVIRLTLQFLQFAIHLFLMRSGRRQSGRVSRARVVGLDSFVRGVLAVCGFVCLVALLAIRHQKRKSNEQHDHRGFVHEIPCLPFASLTEFGLISILFNRKACALGTGVR